MKRLLAESLFDVAGRIWIADVGAMPSTDAPRYLPLVQRGLASVCAFDCNEGFIRAMDGSPGQAAVPACIADGSLRDFYRTKFPGCSSLYEPDAAMIDLFFGVSATHQEGNFRVVERQRIQTARLDDVLTESPDLITLDVQGGELDVLRHGMKAMESASMIDVEAEFIPIYKGQPLFGDVQCFMAERGWMLHKLYDLSGRCFIPVRLQGYDACAISQLLWARALFVRDLRNLSDIGDLQLARAAALLYDMYLSYDLAYRYLAEFDRRNGGSLRDHIATHLPEGEVPRLYLNEVGQIDYMPHPQ